MTTLTLSPGDERRMSWARRPEEEIAELSLLLPVAQIEAIDSLASSQGLTLGQLIRRLIHDHLLAQALPRPVLVALPERFEAFGEEEQYHEAQ